ncbi:type I-C CRISPR-associated protein Cas7/Csd2 [Ruminococcus sp.]|uniref:type I-C CRISPR-associated protein Cas7/Csd2 n=1 Tax=Ruminococcus sp. TaxID=41978 RepID=UPI002E769986|nr:type I-C CRISPR-associated protein Cas7/Csd2 [Ruminococcus sp.]MEE1263461.1 type I-C CRISPR-associated protein Cas7/Csd2 [Ruminococcus sp.]
MINNRYDFIMLFDVENGNPNGDPDAGNTPRIDAESGYGYITDVCLKRKIRNYVELVKEGEKGYRILIKADRALNSKFDEAYEAENLKKGQKGKNTDDVNKAREYMCKNYFDVRAFGAVMSTGDNPCGIVRGPVQINFSRSISPINIQDVTITRQARTTGDRMETGSTEMGKKSIIPYALYRAEGYVSAALANKVTDLSEGDLELLWTAIINMFEEDHSAARGKMCMRKLIVFKHDNVLGNCPSHILFDKIKVKEVSAPPRCFSDYSITIDADLPSGVELIEKI